MRRVWWLPRSVLVVALATLCSGDARQGPAPTIDTPAAIATTPTAATTTAQPAKPVPHGRLEAKVVAKGVPAAGAIVYLADGSRPVLAKALTDARGIARFEQLAPGAYELWARRVREVSPVVRVGDVDAAKPVELELALGGAIRGHIVADGKLPKGATIALVPLDVDHAIRIAALEDDDTFAVDGVPRGRWRIEGEAAGYVQSEPLIAEVGGPASDLALHMVRTAMVAGTVVDVNGNPVGEATVMLRRQGAPAMQELAPRAGASSLRWVHPLAGQRVLPPGDALRFGASRPGTRPAECGMGHCGVDIGWQKGTVIHAAADGKIELAYTEIHGEAGRSIAIEHPGGIRTLYLHLDELRPGLEIGQTVRAGDPIGRMGATGFAAGPHLHFAMTQVRDGRFWYVDPEPILRRAIVLPAPRPYVPVDPRFASAALDTSAAAALAVDNLRTDAHGRFRVAGVSPGTYVAVAFAAQLAPGTSPIFNIAAGAELGDVVITLRPGVLVQGRIADKRGPLGGANVIALSGSGENVREIARAFTGADGEYTLRALDGSVTLAVSAPDHGGVERALELADARQVRRHEDFVLVEEMERLRGQVLAQDGAVIANAEVRVVEGPTKRRAVSDGAGNFAIEHVAAGTYVVEVASPDYPVTRVPIVPERWREIRLERGGGVRVTVYDGLAATPLAGIRIDAVGPEGRTANATTDARGIAELRGLVAGAWDLRTSSRGYAEVHRAITIRASTLGDDIRFDITRGAAIIGTVRDRRGTRIAGAAVTVGAVTTKTDADGNFRIPDLARGTYTITAELDGARGSATLTLVPGDEVSLDNLEIR